MQNRASRERTPFHKAFRAIQLDYAIRLATVARRFGISPPAAHALVARGRPPDWFVARLGQEFELSGPDRSFLKQAAEATAALRGGFDAETADDHGAEIARAFADGLRDLGEEEAEKIRELLAARGTSAG